MMLIRGVVHYADKLPNGSPLFRYLMHELTDECNHIQMFQEFINRTGEDVPGMRRGSRILGPILAFIGGYANFFHFIGVLCGEQPLHYQQTLQHRGEAHVPPLLNKITYIHLAEEARHITFADDYLDERMKACRAVQAGVLRHFFPFYLRWLIGEMFGPPRTFARQFGVPRQVFKTAYLAERLVAPVDVGIGCRRTANSRRPRSTNGVVALDVADVGYRRADTALPR